MPGFTHLQAAQPVTFGHHLLAYVEMFGRDRGRFADARARLNECPLGAAALAGTSFPIDRACDRREPGLRRGRRATRSMPSRIATSRSSSWRRPRSRRSTCRASPRSWCCGRRRSSASCAWPRSSRAAARSCRKSAIPTPPSWCAPRAAGSIGSLCGLLLTLKGLPLAYSKDLQEDKEPVFDAADSLALCLAASAAMIEGMAVDPCAPRRRRRGRPSDRDRSRRLAGARARPAVPRRARHRRAGGAAGRGAGRRSRRPAARGAAGDRAAHHGAGARGAGVERSVASRTSFGGTAPERVRAAITAARERFL